MSNYIIVKREDNPNYAEYVRLRDWDEYKKTLDTHWVKYTTEKPHV